MSALHRARTALRQRGLAGLTAGAADEARARLELAAHRRRPPVTFVVDGTEHTQLVHLHNRTWRNERAVEIPLTEAFLARTSGPVLEVGNVLAGYDRSGHVVVDRYEQHAGVLNVDVVDYETSQRFGAIVAISTLEHVGWDEDVRDPTKIPRAVQHLRGLLGPTGRMLVTCPLSYNPHLDALIRAGTLAADREAFLTVDGGRWRQVDQAAAFAGARMGPHGGTSIWVAELGPS